MEKIGIGYDIHRLVDDRKLFLGGVEIPYIKGLLGHSDGDALLHALCDALLGAMGEGDIGEHFPDTDSAYQNISSVGLLIETFALVKKNDYIISNIDAVVIAQEPNLAPFKKPMRLKISSALGIPEERINIKAKTNNGLGEIGAKAAIACFVAVILTNTRR
ncbi:MAG: 2-C-methyl-D-erythritol 2,4-cyclodiphosphate synthase [Candidatus Omnitrophica bacterium]|nr:2-C-methyl-D-erythritol 2,4-cyclodiphosphate synthase [Candidatus Omnitrophota bacterium]